MNKERTGENLKAIRTARKMSLNKLAEKVNASVGTVSNHEKYGVATIDFVLRYAEALGCEPVDLLVDTVDIEKYSLEEDITSFYPWNLAFAVMIGSVPTKSSVEKFREQIYRVYVPALKEAIIQLTEREQKVLELRFVHGLTYEQCGYRFNVTRERIRQVEQKALRKLRNPRFAKHYILDTLDKAFQIDHERNLLAMENERLRNELVKYEVKVEPPVKERPKISIDNMELSVRSYNCLRRAGFNYVQDLKGKTVEDLKHVRNMGMKSIREVVEKAREFGVIIKEAEDEENPSN